MPSATSFLSIHPSSSVKAHDSQHGKFLISCSVFKCSIVYQMSLSERNCFVPSPSESCSEDRCCETDLQLPSGFSRSLFIVHIQKAGNSPGTGNSRLLMEEMWNFNHRRNDSWNRATAKYKSCVTLDLQFVLMSVCVGVYLLHCCVATNKLLPQVGDVMVEPPHVLLKVLSEGQQRFLDFTLELPEPKTFSRWTEISRR